MLRSKSAGSKDLDKIQSLLSANKLCFNDINQDGVSLFVVEKEDQHIGYFGIELFDTEALFRSMIVLPQERDKGYGEGIWQLALNMIKERGIKDVYLLTNTAASFFEKLGFEVFDRNAVPDVIGQTSEFAEFCAEDSVCMHYKI